jgi:hypothetical protein
MEMSARALSFVRFVSVGLRNGMIAPILFEVLLLSSSDVVLMFFLRPLEMDLFFGSSPL